MNLINSNLASKPTELAQGKAQADLDAEYEDGDLASLVEQAQADQRAEDHSHEAVYGCCPKCGHPGVQRERRLNGNDMCTRGCTYPSASAVQCMDKE